jgi:hypothetical protein
MEKAINLEPKKLHTKDDFVRHSKILEQLEMMYDGVEFSASLSLLGSIFSFCGDDEDEVAGGNTYFENWVEELFHVATGLEKGFMDIMSHCVDLNRKGILVLYDIGGGAVGYGFSKKAFDSALKSVSVH